MQLPKEAFQDNRYVKAEYRKELNVHPRDWTEAWGYDKPILWRPMIFSKRQRVEQELYPHYDSQTGWAWTPKESLKYQRRFENK
jgi:hypothetical protein